MLRCWQLTVHRQRLCSFRRKMYTLGCPPALAALLFCVGALVLVGVMSSRGIPKDKLGMYPRRVLKRPLDADDTFISELGENTRAVWIGDPTGWNVCGWKKWGGIG